MSRNIPNLSSKFVCIVDHLRQDLAAVISSYIATKDYYPLLFEFPTVSAPHYERKNEEIDENIISIIRAGEFRTFVNNILAMISPVENLIIAGLSNDQKSYLDFLEHFNVIEIKSIEHIDFMLSPFIESKGKIECNSSDLLNGLNAALRSNSVLKLKEDAADIELKNSGGKGLVVIETEPFVATIIAVNYAFSIDADVAFVPRASEEERLIILDRLAEYGEGDMNAKIEICEFVNLRINHISFRASEFVTYFTTGLPYSFVTDNFLPSTYVNCHLRPDFFIVNNLISYGTARFGGAVVFSPEFFEDEETQLVSKLLSQANYFVKELFGEKANIFNFDLNIKQFPYDVFHICSHGGELEGHTVEEEFTDRDGVKHTVVYDELLSFSPSMRADLISVQRKYYLKKFDGMDWRSTELKAKYIPQYVFADMQNALHVSEAVNKKIGPKKKINNSSGIQCSDGPHLAMFQTIASQSSPLVFNNTCWSWYYVAETFLTGGAKCYIGTLWNVGNRAAIDFASTFYKMAFSHSIMDAVHKSLKAIVGSASENIYIVWGLHFARLTYGMRVEKSREQVFEELMRSAGAWQYNLRSTLLKSTRDTILDLLKWIYVESKTTFNDKDFALFTSKSKELKAKKKE
jgi:CHAT domain